MSLSHEHVGLKISAKIKIYPLTRAELLFPLCYEIPCILQWKKSLERFGQWLCFFLIFVNWIFNFRNWTIKSNLKRSQSTNLQTTYNNWCIQGASVKMRILLTSRLWRNHCKYRNKSYINLQKAPNLSFNMEPWKWL